jgi:hypothetical protein
MRGGGAGDPLKDVKKDVLVTVVLKENVHPNEYDPDIHDETVICRVVSVDEKSKLFDKVVKVVKLIITNENYTFCYVYGGNSENGLPIKHRKEFEISYTQSEESTDSPYKLIIYKESNQELQVIPGRYYTHIIPDGYTGSLVNSQGYVIKSVKPITASR